MKSFLIRSILLVPCLSLSAYAEDFSQELKCLNALFPECGMSSCGPATPMMIPSKDKAGRNGYFVLTKTMLYFQAVPHAYEEKEIDQIVLLEGIKLPVAIVKDGVYTAEAAKPNATLVRPSEYIDESRSVIRDRILREISFRSKQEGKEFPVVSSKNSKSDDHPSHGLAGPYSRTVLLLNRRPKERALLTAACSGVSDSAVKDAFIKYNAEQKAIDVKEQKGLRAN